MKPDLLPGEEICPECKGTGKKRDKVIGGAGYEIISVCERCWGDGKLDWIEMAMGKAYPLDLLSSALYWKGRRIFETTESGIKVEGV
jgi:hypothetical protein